MSDDQANGEWKPPYASYVTLTNFVDKKCGDNPLPPQIDKTFLDNMAGGTQSILLATLKMVDFIDEDNNVTMKLREAAGAPAKRKEHLKSWAQDFYSEQLALAAKNATAQMLHQSFAKSGYTGSTLRKAIVFYLSLVDDLGLPNSPHFKPPKQSPAGKPRGKNSGKATPPKPDEQQEARQKTDESDAPSGDRRDFVIGNYGSVTLFADVPWLRLDAETFTKLRGVISALEDLAPVDSDSDEDDDFADFTEDES